MNIGSIASNLGIKLDKNAQLKDSGKAYVKTVRQRDVGNLSIGSLGSFASNGGDLKVVVDPFSGKYYGEADSSSFIQHYEQMVKGLEKALEYINKNGKPLPRDMRSQVGEGGMASVMGNSLPVMPFTEEDKQKVITSYTKQLEEARSELGKFQNNYVQKEKMLPSFQFYGDNWNNYFEGSYRTSRIAEDNDLAAQRNGQQTQSGTELKAQTDLKIPKTVGTGISGTTSLNPYGQLDAGLNI